MAEFGLPGVLQPGDGMRRRVAGARWRPAADPRPAGAARIQRRGAQRHGRSARWRGRILALAGALALLVPLAPQAQVVSSRIWPAPEYTRLTLESTEEIRYSLFSVKDPERLVLDLEVADIAPALAELQGKVAADDPYIGGLRVARNRPGVVRLVLDLKTEVKPQVFTLKPIAEYGHRLVLDVYPIVPIDPLAQLIEETQKRQAAQRPRVARLATIVIDPGHGGEDPGAIGRRGSREKNITLSIARRLKALVDAEPNMRGVLTRDGDYFLQLDARVEKARKLNADLLVSIHADAYV